MKINNIIAYGTYMNKLVNIYADCIEDFDKGKVQMYTKNKIGQFIEIDSRYFNNIQFECYA